MLRKIFALIFRCEFNRKECSENLLGCSCGKGKKEEAPQYREDPSTTAMKLQLGNKISGLLDTPYQTYVDRFTPSQETQTMLNDSISRYQGLLDTEDYGIGNYDEIEGKYLDTILGQYGKTREESYKPIQESLIAENLFGSGPGYDIMGKYGKESAEGAADISAVWAREGIDRRYREKTYADALKRGDYGMMYQLALNKAQMDVNPQVMATDAQLSTVNPGISLFGSMQQGDLQKYQAQLDAYQANSQNTSSFGGLGSLLGAGAGLGIAAAFPGALPLTMGLMAAGGGSIICGSFLSIFKY